MTRTAIRRRPGTLAVLALIALLATDPTFAQGQKQTSLDTAPESAQGAVNASRSVAAHTRGQQTAKRRHYEFRWWQDYGN
jgi:Tfp pilus assembly protein FimT